MHFSVPIVNECAATVPDEITVADEKEEGKETEQGNEKILFIFAIPKQVVVSHSDQEDTICFAVSVDPKATVPVESTVETKDQEDTVVKKENDTVAKEEANVEQEDEEEVTVIDPPSPTVIPGPAKNFVQFAEHFKALKHDPAAFGNYFLVSNF